MMGERAARTQPALERETIAGPQLNGPTPSRALERWPEALLPRDGRAPPSGATAQALAWLSASGASNRALHALVRPTKAGPAPAGAGQAEGRPLDPAVRAEMEAHLGADLARVRVHTDPAAEASATALEARAYTVGHDIVFGPGEYRPADPAGRALLAHELTHVVQQARGGAEPAGSESSERAAAASVARLEAGNGPAPVTTGSAPGIARQPVAEGGPAPAQVDDALGVLGDAAVDALTTKALGTGLQQRMAKAAMRGFIAELGRQVKAPEAAAKFKSSLRELAIPGNLAGFVGGYVGGAAAGLVSPATDLLGLGALAEQLPAIVTNLGRRAWQQGSELAREAAELARSVAEFNSLALSKVAALLKDPKGVYAFLEARGPEAVQAAGDAGRTAARQVVGFFTSKDEGEAKPAESLRQVLTTFTDEEKSGLFSLVTSKATRLRQAATSTPWSRFGYNVGHALGAVVSNLLLLVFSEGVGNAITKIAGWLGDVAPLLGRGAKGLAALGRAIAAAEHAVAEAITKGLKLLKPLEAIVSPFLKLFGRLQFFLRRLLGVAGHEAGALAARAGAAVVDEAGARASAAATRPARGGAAVVDEAGARASAEAPRPAPSGEAAIVDEAGARASAVEPGPAPGGEAALGEAAAAPPAGGGLKAGEGAPPSGTPAPAAPKGRPPVRGATAKGVGESFSYRYHDPVPTPEVYTARRPVKPPARTAEPTPSEPTRPAPASGEDLPSIEEQVAEDLAAQDQRVSPDARVIEAGEAEPSIDTPTVTPTPNQRTYESFRASEELAEAMARKGNPRPPGHQTHHIVAYNDPRAREACAILEEAGINPRNDWRNGIHLPRTTLDPRTTAELPPARRRRAAGARPARRRPPGRPVTPEAFSRHETIHTDAYYENITERLREARIDGTVEQTLDDIYGEIAEGQFPHPRLRD